MYRLYSSPGSCSMAPHVVLRELGLPFEITTISLKEGQNRTPEFLKINPRGSVPVLVTPNGQIVREGAAILLHLLETQDSDLLPRGVEARATALEWLMFCNATLHPAYSRLFFFRKQLGDEAKDNPLAQTSAQYLQKLWDEVEAHLSDRSYLCGEDITVADILMTVIAGWTAGLYLPVTIGGKTRQMMQRVIKRDSFQAAFKAEHVTHSMASAA